MPARFQLVIDCKDPELMARFWAAALGYVLEPPPEGFATWDDWRRDIGFPDSELGIGADSIVDPRKLQSLLEGEKQHPQFSGGRKSVIDAITSRLVEVADQQ